MAGAGGSSGVSVKPRGFAAGAALEGCCEAAPLVSGAEAPAVGAWLDNDAGDRLAAGAGDGPWASAEPRATTHGPSRQATAMRTPDRGTPQVAIRASIAAGARQFEANARPGGRLPSTHRRLARGEAPAAVACWSWRNSRRWTRRSHWRRSIRSPRRRAGRVCAQSLPQSAPRRRSVVDRDGCRFVVGAGRRQLFFSEAIDLLAGAGKDACATEAGRDRLCGNKCVRRNLGKKGKRRAPLGAEMLAESTHHQSTSVSSSSALLGRGAASRGEKE